MRTTLLSMLSLLAGACAAEDSSGAGGGSASNDLVFHGEQSVLPSFAYDTGLLPAASPVQLQLKLSAGGGLTADAKAIAGGSGDALAIAGVPGSGLFKLDAHIKLEGMLHVDVQGGLRYDGPIPGIENLDISFGGEAVFDPFLLDGKTAKVTAPIPEIKLPPIPLPGGLPGSLNITVATGSVLTTELAGDCAGFSDHTAELQAHTSTGGTLVLASEIVIKIPVIGEKKFPIPSVTVQIPAFTAAMELGKVEFQGGGSAPSGVSLMAKDGCSAGGGGGGGGGGGEQGVCNGTLPQSYAPVWHPPNGAHAGLCSTTQIGAFEAACTGGTGSEQACKTFRQNNPACTSCLVTPHSSPGYGPVVIYETMTIFNIPGCIALKAPAELACAKSIESYIDCLDTACASCAPGDDTALQACQTAADSGACKQASEAYTTCADRLQSGAASSCFGDNMDLAFYCGS